MVHPGFTDTPMVRAMGEELIQKQVIPYTQLRRLIRPEEIADAICFLVSNSAVSGELWADAGWHPMASMAIGHWRPPSIAVATERNESLDQPSNRPLRMLTLVS